MKRKAGRPSKGDYQIKTLRIRQSSVDAMVEMSQKTGLSQTYIMEQAILKYVKDWKKKLKTDNPTE